jgi:cytochrome c-type biogenesis protein CcmE
MVKKNNVILATAIIVVCAVSFLFLLVNSTVPVFSVKELMNYEKPDSLVNKKIQVVGVVRDINSTGFFITDPEDRNNATLIVYVNSTNVEKPTGFESGKTVLVEGKLLSMTNIWTFKASLISTKCPSKYKE